MRLWVHVVVAQTSTIGNTNTVWAGIIGPQRRVREGDMRGRGGQLLRRPRPPAGQ